MNRWAIVILAVAINTGTSTMLFLKGIPKPGEPLPVPPEATALPPAVWSFKTEAVDEMVEELRIEREKVQGERKELDGLRAQLGTERRELEKVRTEIKTMREEIDQRVLEIEENELKNLKGLATTYSLMNPPAAVAILREMDENMAVKILALMKSDRVSPILAEMTKAEDRTGEESMSRRAARISDKLRLIKPVKKDNA